MMSNNRRSAPVINDHLPIEKEAESTVLIAETRGNDGNHPASDIRIDFFIWGVTSLLKNQSYMHKTDG
jgi:hypothetical protein